MYIDVILPVPIAHTFTYFVPPEQEAQIVIGGLVCVEFGKNKGYSGIVYKILDVPPPEIEKIKPIIEVVSSEAIIRPAQLPFWQWISNYYLCKLGEVSRTVLPAVIRSKEKPKKPRKRKIDNRELSLQPLHTLTEAQQTAWQQINRCFSDKEVCLLHGAAASGKTEIYTHLMQETLQANRQVLYLLPEIALTTPLIQRLKQFFGETIGIFHSKISNGERIKLWNNLLHDEGCQMVLGVRSSVFLPFRDLGLVIVDEEHEPGYKQQDPAPRYHARNAAIVLANLHKAKVVLGSATPSLESFYNAQNGKYGYVRLDKRFEKTLPLSITAVDVKELRRKKQMKGILSPLLLERMQETLAQGSSVLLFQNRWGTEEVEKEIHALFPNEEQNILIRTQMISKGLNFENVRLTGILNADGLMKFPDFRAYERAYQLMSQTAQGEVILQTTQAEHPLIQQVLQQDYAGMYRMQMEERELFKYPPLFRLIEMTLKHRNLTVLSDTAHAYATLLRKRLGNRVVGPDQPAVGKVQGLHVQKIVLKIEHSASLTAVHEILEQTQMQMIQNPAYRYVIVQYDVDPV